MGGIWSVLPVHDFVWSPDAQSVCDGRTPSTERCKRLPWCAIAPLSLYDKPHDVNI